MGWFKELVSIGFQVSPEEHVHIIYDLCMPEAIDTNYFTKKNFNDS